MNQNNLPNPIRTNNLMAKIEAHSNIINESIQRVIQSGNFILGSEVQNFEEKFAQYLNAKFCVGVANGTDAIELGLKALGIERDDYVATAANAGMYSTTAILAVGAKPLFMDVDLVTKITPLAEIEKSIKDGAKIVIITHLFGLCTPEIEQIAAICQANNVRLLEDCSQAHGAQVNGKFAGTFGDLSTFSFYPTKNLGALGDGGAVITNEIHLFNQLRGLRQYGWTSKYHVGTRGGKNSRLDEMQAALLSAFLPYLDEDNAKRRVIAKKYYEKIKNSKVILPPFFLDNYVAHLYVIRCEDREGLRSHLLKHGIIADIHYPVLDYKQNIFRNQFSSLNLPNSENLTREVLTLPCYPEMSSDIIEHVIKAVNSW